MRFPPPDVVASWPAPKYGIPVPDHDMYLGLTGFQLRQPGSPQTILDTRQSHSHKWSNHCGPHSNVRPLYSHSHRCDWWLAGHHCSVSCDMSYSHYVSCHNPLRMVYAHLGLSVFGPRSFEVDQWARYLFGFADVVPLEQQSHKTLAFVLLPTNLHNYKPTTLRPGVYLLCLVILRSLLLDTSAGV